MLINVIDKNKYFKGLLTLLMIGENAGQFGKELIREIGTLFQINIDYAEKAFNSFFKSEYSINYLPHFSNYEIAESFIKDGMRISFLNKVINFRQIEFLTMTALKNDISKQLVYIELENILECQNFNFDICFEVQKYINHNQIHSL